MAEATTNFIQVSPTFTGVTLTLSEDEALELVGFLGNTTGPPSVLEDMFDTLADALKDSGVYPVWSDIAATSAFRRGVNQPTCR